MWGCRFRPGDGPHRAPIRLLLFDEIGQPALVGDRQHVALTGPADPKHVAVAGSAGEHVALAGSAGAQHVALAGSARTTCRSSGIGWIGTCRTSGFCPDNMSL